MTRKLWSRCFAAGLLVTCVACDEGNDDGPEVPLEASVVADASFIVDAGDSAAPPLMDAAPGATASSDAGSPFGGFFGGGFPFDAGRAPIDTGVRDAAAAATDASPAGALADAAADGTEPGRLAGITAAHNRVRAMVQTNSPLPPLQWSPTIAAYAQQWADMLASAGCTTAMHRSGAELSQKGYGENLAVMGGFSFGGSGAAASSAEQAVKGWADEVQCWTYGTIGGFGLGGTEQCNQTCYQNMHSDGCGHYTQIVWRSSRELGCGVASCNSGFGSTDVWICNYSPAGNFVGQAPY